jgi:cytochrome b pre-mRNA-processing protein 3|tara:strand:- start:4 stop:507 length:504 start_codon:yes stop_codon:yes gene_type:complete
MISIFKKHPTDLYNILLTLSRNIFFYKKLKLPDNFETRIYLMFFHFSIFMIIFKKKQNKFDQKEYDILFQNIENDLRELGFGDVTVNKKMKQLNKVLYDILLKLESNKSDINIFKLDHKLVIKYFSKFKHSKDQEYIIFETYFLNFYNFCFELSLDNMIRNAIKFRN